MQVFTVLKQLDTQLPHERIRAAAGDDSASFATFTQNFLLPNGQIDITSSDLFGNANYKLYNIKESNLSSVNELGFLKLLKDKNSGLKVLKGSNNSNSWAELSIKNGIVDPKPCN
ncbi:hypothetical protein [Chryseobacterium sp. Leaf394]|uniref:hypothetical protein n=1 Tax=Chryseobacterium sp. Leaf394 TaxID=1736361 RepID=UPI0006F48215|nr:hypothetical protein [Chryseobacterium sp. Leaf394]KQS94314.1 hypothetical protein ASG21_18985 [Chryseobacterium sp. Leaf394]